MVPVCMPTVLVVDDEPVNIKILLNILKDSCKVKVAKDGQKALDLARKDPSGLDLVLLDVVMPGLDGYEVCRRLKDDPLTQSIPVVFVSGRDSDEERSRGRALGATGYLTKPVEPEQVLQIVESVTN